MAQPTDRESFGMMLRTVALMAACCGLFAAGCAQTQNASLPAGGASVARVSPEEFGNYRILQNFDGSDYGASPSGTLSRYLGLMYGTAFDGGDKGFGTVFRVAPDGRNTYVLHSFEGDKDGCTPVSGVTFAERSNKYYGTTRSCGPKKGGTLFFGQASSRYFQVVHAFDTATDGGGSEAAPYFMKKILYGTTRNGGPNGKGTLYSVDTDTGTFKMLHAFGAGDDAAHPAAGVIEVDGKLVGTSVAGGKNGAGTVYTFDPSDGKEAVLHSFVRSDGAQPATQLLSWAGVLYGVTPGGGIGDAGVLFKMNPTNGDTTVLYDFNEGNGDRPEGALLIFKDALYGTTSKGGPFFRRCGTIFRFTLATKKMDDLHTFNGQPDDGCHPRGGLAYSLADRRDQLFGTTLDGGSKELGTAYAFSI